MRQLPLDIVLSETARFDNFIVGTNEVVVGLCENMAQANGDQQIYVWGSQSSGKSHLLQAACSLAAQSNISAAYLPLLEVLSYGSVVLEGMEQLSLLCIDDVQLCAGKDDWEVGLFNLINACRMSGTRLLLSGNTVPTQLDIRLNDLLSRLSWGGVFQLEELDDDARLTWIKQLAESRGLEMSSDVGAYILRHCPRDMSYLTGLVKALDVLSLTQKKKLSIALVKEAKDQLSGAGK